MSLRTGFFAGLGWVGLSLWQNPAQAQTQAQTQAVAGAPAASAKVMGVSPQGEVGIVRQVLVRYDRATAPQGDPRQTAPFTLKCNGQTPAGSGYWVDDKRWVYDLDSPILAGQRCTLSPSKGSNNSSGATTPSEYHFTTGGPAVAWIQPSEGNQIEEDQHFLVQVTGVVDPASVQSKAWCEVEGVGERLGLRLVTGPTYDAVVKEHAQSQDAKLAARQGRLLLLACQRPFAPKARVRLVWGAGIAGVATPGQAAVSSKQAQRWQWNVRDRFTAELSCERENAAAPCLPLRPITLRFSRPVPRALALAALLQFAPGATANAGASASGTTAALAAGGLAAKAPEGEESNGSFSEVRFMPPLPEGARLQVVLPPNIVDDSGRALANVNQFPKAMAVGELPPLAKFNGNGFGIVEAGTAPGEPAMLPLTVRQVQADLQGASTAGQVAIKHLGPASSDLTLLQWLARVQRWHERVLTAQEAGLPQAQWVETVTETDARGRTRSQQRERSIDTRELALLAREGDVRRADLPQLKGATARATEVLGVPLPERGLHVVEVSSRILGNSLLAKNEALYVRTAALATNLAVHFKKGRSSSLVWVTTLDRAKPVTGAKVVVNDCNGKPLWSGTTDASGMARIERGFGEDEESGGRGNSECLSSDGLFVTARGGDGKAAGPQDMAFVFSRWQRGIESWRFNIDTARGTQSDVRAHTVFDRTLLRLGETLSMKHYVREERQTGLATLPPERLPDSLLIRHIGSGQEFVQALAWPRGARSAESSWAIPKSAPMGLYDVTLRKGSGDTIVGMGGGRVRVEAFRTPLVDARASLPKGPLVAPKSVDVNVQINAFAGGPMPGTALKAAALLSEDEPPRFTGYEDYSFSGLPRGEGAGADPSEEGEGGGRNAPRVVARDVAASTDAQGAAKINLPNLPTLKAPAQLRTEVSFADPNGETQTVSQRATLWPAAVVVGIRAPEWAVYKGAARFGVVVLDTNGKPLAGRAVQVSGRQHQTLSTRKRIVGGFYAYDNQNKVTELGALCSGTTDAQGRLECDSPTSAAGEVELVASAKDEAGRESRAATRIFVGNGERWWFAQGNDDRIDLLPERREVEPGQIARLQVRMPFESATALVTVEREGVIDARVVNLSGRNPFIELPIPHAFAAASTSASTGASPDSNGGHFVTWAPNVTVGVLVLRGRLREAPWWSLFTWGWRDPSGWWQSFRYEGREWRAPTAMVDLAKPSYKFGATALTIGLAAHKLDVKVSTPQTQYKIREKVPVTIRVLGADGKPAAGAEVALAAVDEGLLALSDNTSWDLLAGLMQPRPWGVETATAASEVIGRRHYGRKAMAPGGGGGRNPTRELFETLLLWRGTVALDAKGEAQVQVPLNDSLTSFRIVAVADDGAQRFGQGQTVVRVSQDLQLLPGLAPIAREGDRFDAGFTVRNGSERTMQVQVNLSGQAVPAEGSPTALNFPPQSLSLAAGAAQELRFAVQVPQGLVRMEWEAKAVELGSPVGSSPGSSSGSSAAGSTKPSSGQTPASDAVKVIQAVQSPVPVRVWQASLSPLDGSPISVAAPAGQLPGRGGVQVVLQPKLSGALPGLKRFFELYPYSCLEQKTSRAIALNDQTAWAKLTNEVGGYLDADGLAHYFPAAAGSGNTGSDTLTAYLLASAHEAGLAWPQAQREHMLAGLTAFVEGRLERRFASPAAASLDLDVRKLAALDALARHGRAEARMLGSIAFTPAVWPTSALLDAWSLLQRLPASASNTERLAQVQNIVRSRLSEGGTTLKFNTEDSDGWWWLMQSPDGNAAKLLLAAVQSPAWRDDVPRLVNGALARQKGGAWGTTTANLWGVLALTRFAKVFETQAVSGRSSLSLGSDPRSARTVDWAINPEGDSVLLPWPSASGAAAGGASAPIAGPTASLQARHQGQGKPWITVQTLAAVPLQAPVSAGYRISRSISAVQRKNAQAWSRGDVLRVRVHVQANADMSWVVIQDPIPAGATILGSGLGRDSAIATQGEQREGAAWAAYEERSAEAFRAYYAWLPRGTHVLEYSVRLNSAGRFGLPPARVEAMYAPERFAETPVAALEVAP